MKKLLIALAAGFIGFTNLNAQEKEAIGGFEKEDFFITGSVSYTNTSISGIDDSLGSFTIAPAAGYFITENLALQLELSYNSLDIINVTGFANSRDTFGVAAGVNYFFTPAQRFSFTLEGNVFYANTSEDNNFSPDTNTFGIVVSPGINYFISNSFALNASVGALGFNSSKDDIDGARARNTFVFNMNLSTIALGLTYKF
ncbi:outer membrane beta-barrel protein [Tenacibaculum sp. ZS6-P6]|uniref:outer membrane beta-barrel protein n=1 Tax=Tenacibaculum sp. ZS6-P6 TaxID=3447503 RepID=UPI003F9D3E83